MSMQKQNPGFDVLNRPPDEFESGDLNSLVRDLMRRVRVIEERYSSVRRNIQVNEQNMIGMSKSITTEVRTANNEMLLLKQEVHDLREEMRLMVNELKQTVKKDELKTLQKYIQLWEPLNFVSHDEMQRYVDQVLENKTFIKQRGK
jgi:hypothetical protein